MKIKFQIILLIIFSLSAPGWSYQKTVEGDTLKIRAYASKRAGNTVYFNSRRNKQDVVLSYGKTKIKANEAVLEETQNKIFIKGGFYSQYLDNEIIGQTVIYNPLNNFFDAEHVTVKSKSLVSKAETFSYYGEKISLKHATLGVDLIKLDIEFDRLDLYPGWIVADQIYLKVLQVPIVYTPTLVVDNRRNAYKLPTPLPEAGKTAFRGDYWRFNTHYYVNELLYGNLQFGRAKEKGAGYGGQFIFRFSDYDQFNYINENWQYGRTQEVYSYEHSFMELPMKKKRKLTFNEMLTYNDEIKNLPANSLRINRTKFEEINEEVINRYQEVIYEGRFVLPYEKINLYTKDSGSAIEEFSTNKEATKYEVLNEIDREFEIAYFGALTPGFGYDSIQYSIKPYSWHRLYDYVQLTRKFWIFEGYGRVTDYLNERGASPFNFDQKYELNDNVKTSVFVDILNVKLGQTVQYTTQDGHIFDILYHLKWKTNSWTLKTDYSKRKELWSVGVEIDVL